MNSLEIPLFSSLYLTCEYKEPNVAKVLLLAISNSAKLITYTQSPTMIKMIMLYRMHIKKSNTIVFEENEGTIIPLNVKYVTGKISA